MKRISFVVAATLLLAAMTRFVSACPFCIAPMQTWAEMVSEANVVVLARLVSTSDGSNKQAPHAMMEVMKVHKGKSLIPASNLVSLDDYVFGQTGDVFLLKGSLQDVGLPALTDTFANDYEENVTGKPNSDSKIQTVSATAVKDSSNVSVLKPAKGETEESLGDSKKELVWDYVERVTEESFSYIVNAPDPSVDPVERLKYFVKFLEHSDQLVASDAWGEFANSQYSDIAKIRELYPRASLRTWISNKNTSPERLGLYGMLLGLCGTSEDALFLRQQIGQPVNDDIRFGVEGMMGGLLLLEGEGGLQFLEKTRIETPGVSSLECFAVVQALQFVYVYEPDLLPKQRLRDALHPLVQHSEMREIVIRNLARWEDWGVLAQLGEAYEASKADDQQTAMAVVGFLLTCQKAESASEAQKAAATELLDMIRKDNPKLVKTTERQLR